MKELIALGMIVTIAITVAATIWVVQSKMEASAFNAVTGKNVTTWQAMWIELRVQEGSK